MPERALGQETATLLIPFSGIVSGINSEVITEIISGTFQLAWRSVMRS
ncbi:hypothetical protein T261_03130 [Streptomyces lydicus]|nr:hypothetical protein T261_03130 [Streptomyces lydicus]